MRNWKRLLAGFVVAAMLLTGCSSSDLQAAGEIASAALSIAEEMSDEASSEATTAADTEDAENPLLVVGPGPEVSEESDAGGPNFDVAAAEASSEAEPEGKSIAMAPGPQVETPAIDEDGAYYDKDNVALYLVTYHRLPDNYITKKEARALGWEGGALEPYAPGKAIGGDHFGNYEGTLPDDVEYHECDIDTKGKKRGARRIIYSENWDIYYTDDHYETFTQLYEGEK